MTGGCPGEGVVRGGIATPAPGLTPVVPGVVGGGTVDGGVPDEAVPEGVPSGVMPPLPVGAGVDKLDVGTGAESFGGLAQPAKSRQAIMP